MDVQRWILRNVLAAHATHISSFAYKQGCGIMSCAKQHTGARWLIKADLRSFFDNVRERQIYPIFSSLGYPPLLSLELTRLCTRAPLVEARSYRNGKYGGKAPYSLARRGRVPQEGRLPQGAPTSGHLANIVMREPDAALTALASEEELVYTRYSDDLVFSAAGDLSRQRAARIIGQISRVVGEAGFRLHRDKTRVIPPGARHVVLGLLLVGDEVRLQSAFKRRIELHVRGVTNFGLREHAEFRGFESILSFINHVDGLLAFSSSIEPQFADRVASRWEAALAANGFQASG